MCQTVVLDDLAQRRQRIGEQCGFRDARGPDRRVDVGRFVLIESRGQPLAGRVLREDVDSIEGESFCGQPQTHRVALGHAQLRQRAGLQEERPGWVDRLGRNAPLLEQLIVVTGEHDTGGRAVGEPLVLLVLAKGRDRVQVRRHGEHVVG